MSPVRTLPREFADLLTGIICHQLARDLAAQRPLHAARVLVLSATQRAALRDALQRSHNIGLALAHRLFSAPPVHTLPPPRNEAPQVLLHLQAALRELEQAHERLHGGRPCPAATGPGPDCALRRLCGQCRAEIQRRAFRVQGHAMTAGIRQGPPA